jgi:hypothetical protein
MERWRFGVGLDYMQLKAIISQINIISKSCKTQRSDLEYLCISCICCIDGYLVGVLLLCLNMRLRPVITPIQNKAKIAMIWHKADGI